MKFKLNIIFALFFTIFCVNRLQAQEKAFPKKGEGITLFLKRHNRTGISYQKQFIELNKNKLGKGNTLRIGVKYTLPPLQGKEAVASAIKRANYEPLFGKELASYKVTSSELKGACFYLVSGHGGPDPGAPAQGLLHPAAPAKPHGLHGAGQPPAPGAATGREVRLHGGGKRHLRRH